MSKTGYGIPEDTMSVVDENLSAENARWSFSGVADSFEKHVAKSVPLYAEGHELICRYSDFFVTDSSVIYDIGCSAGTLVRKLLNWHSRRSDLRIFGIDPVADMIAKAKEMGGSDHRAQYINDSVVVTDLLPCDLVASYYTMQFIHPKSRQTSFDKIYNSLNWGGALILFEKVRGPDARFQDYSTQIYNDFKLEKGFTEANIVNKTRSLKGVLEPFSTQGNIDLLKRAGFVDIMTICKWVCFEGFLAVK
jgi:tRNA (cmo5U34)-methyltransferase